MNYKRLYDRLIQKGQNRTLSEYTERHHIVPRCMDGTDDVQNIVRLTAEEHYVAHQLLVKIYPKNVALVNAAYAMTKHTSNRRMNNKLFGWLRKRASKLTTGIPKSEETKRKMRKPKSVEHRASISRVQLMNGGNGPEFHSNETKKKIKAWSDENTAFRIKATCPHCDMTGGQGPMKRWHFNNCKNKELV
jgi:hypothetical protein